jgi:hypothetical protein
MFLSSAPIPISRFDTSSTALSGFVTEARTPSEEQISLFTDFAAQAIIALESTCREWQYREMQSELAHCSTSNGAVPLSETFNVWLLSLLVRDTTWHYFSRQYVIHGRADVGPRGLVNMAADIRAIADEVCATKEISKTTIKTVDR